jgi:hypothetical protein
MPSRKPPRTTHREGFRSQSTESLVREWLSECPLQDNLGGTGSGRGLVWRYKDPDNYYIVRANALENNIVLYKVEGGKRISLEPKGTPSKTYGVKQKVPKQTWSTLKVRFDGPRFEVFFDGSRIMEVEDSTFTMTGKTGLWTKADSVTYFDDFRIEKRN